MANIVTWDFMGWKEHSGPAVGVQLKWNKTLLEKFTQISSQINRHSMRRGADTITINPFLEGLLHPDYYDNHRKIFMGGYKVILDETMDKYVIELKNLNLLEKLEFIPEMVSDGQITFKHIDLCEEQKVVEYIEGLLGFIMIENLNVE